MIQFLFVVNDNIEKNSGPNVVTRASLHCIPLQMTDMINHLCGHEIPPCGRDDKVLKVLEEAGPGGKKSVICTELHSPGPASIYPHVICHPDHAKRERDLMPGQLYMSHR